MIKLPFRKDKELCRSLYPILGFYPGKTKLYRQALLHKSSSIKEEKGHWQNNERLEFLGDAILDAVVGDIVYRRFEGKREGFLTNARSRIVQRDTLNQVAHEIGLDRLITSNNHSQAHNSYMAGNAFEALVGAIYLDKGYDACMKFMEKRILDKLIDVDKMAYKEANFKSKMLEWSQKKRIQLKFEVVSQGNEDASTPFFISRVMVEGYECGRAKGYSKKESQQLAAKAAYNLLRRKKDIENRVLQARNIRLGNAAETSSTSEQKHTSNPQATPKQENASEQKAINNPTTTLQAPSPTPEATKDTPIKPQAKKGETKAETAQSVKDEQPKHVEAKAQAKAETAQSVKDEQPKHVEAKAQTKAETAQDKRKKTSVQKTKADEKKAEIPVDVPSTKPVQAEATKEAKAEKAKSTKKEQSQQTDKPQKEDTPKGQDKDKQGNAEKVLKQESKGKQDKAKKETKPKAKAKTTKSESKPAKGGTSKDAKPEPTRTRAPKNASTSPKDKTKSTKGKAETTEMDATGLDIDFSDISMREKTRDEIIAQAEEMAYAEA